MTHTYHITGMTCSGCESKVATDLKSVDAATEVIVSKEKKEAVITMSKHIPLDVLQQALGGEGSKYHISLPGTVKETTETKACCSSETKAKGDNKELTNNQSSGTGTYYCPMHCEGDKTYDKPGDCPVCGMGLVKQVSAVQAGQYTCPMHPEIVQDNPGSCPICGMDLVPMQPKDSEEDKTYQKLWHKMKIALVFSIPVFIITMSDMIPNNPLYKIMHFYLALWVCYFPPSFQISSKISQERCISTLRLQQWCLL